MQYQVFLYISCYITDIWITFLTGYDRTQPKSDPPPPRCGVHPGDRKKSPASTQLLLRNCLYNHPVVFNYFRTMASLFKVGMDPDILSTSVLSTAVSLNIVCQYSMHLNFKGAKSISCPLFSGHFFSGCNIGACFFFTFTKGFFCQNVFYYLTICLVQYCTTFFFEFVYHCN